MTIITCTECNKEIDMPSRRFKMCSICSRQKKLSRCKQYKAQNKEHVSTYNKNWKGENKEHISIYNKEYNVENRDKIQVRQTKQHRERRKVDMKYKMSITIRNRLQKFYKGKRPKTMGLVGLPLNKFTEWIETNFTPDMNWNNHGIEWHIDHVVPCQWFDLSDLTERMVCFHWSNMRPLKSERNLSRGNSCTLNELLNQEISAKMQDKSVNFKPLVTKLLEKSSSGLS